MKKGGSAASFFLCCKNGTGRESDTHNQNDYLYADAPAPGSPNANNVNEYEQKYQYDKMGNVLQVKQLGTNAFTRNFTYNTDVNTLQKVETGGATLIEDYTYDLCGNQVTAGTTRHYQWTAANRLLIYKNQTGSSDPTIYAQYDYDAAGNRVSKLVRTGTAGAPIYYRTIYIDGIFEFHRLENGTTYKKSYAHIADGSSKVSSIRVGDVFPDDISDATVYNLEDHLDGTTIRLNSSGNVIDREEYYPFGDSSLRTFSKKQYRYVGKEKDAESGLYYYGARYYSAWTCRFISVDALAKKYNQLTPYQNAGNNPVGDKDIDGNKSEKTPEGGGVKKSAINIKVDTQTDTEGNLISESRTVTMAQLNEDGSYTIHQVRDSKTYNEKGEVSDHSINSFYESGDDAELVSEQGQDIVELAFSNTSDIATPSLSVGDIETNPKSENKDWPIVKSPSIGDAVEGAHELGKQGSTLTKTTEPLKSTGKNKYYNNNWKGNQHVKTKSVMNKRLVKFLTKRVPVIGHILTAKEIFEGFQADNYTIGPNTMIQTSGAIGSWAGAAAGAAIGVSVGAAIGSVVPVLGTVLGGVVGGVIGAVVGSWLGETGAENSTRMILK